MVYLGIIIAIFTGDLFIKNYMEKTLVEGKENKRLNGFLRFRKRRNFLTKYLTGGSD